jgi:hypothetical protein
VAIPKPGSCEPGFFSSVSSWQDDDHVTALIVPVSFCFVTHRFLAIPLTDSSLHLIIST